MEFTKMRLGCRQGEWLPQSLGPQREIKPVLKRMARYAAEALGEAPRRSRNRSRA